jgi:hypothetical protein
MLCTTNTSSSPALTHPSTTQAEDGDLIVLATDGYSDNVFGETTLIVTDKLLRARPPTVPISIASLADLMVLTARERAQSTTADTPFSKNAASHGYNFEGGKIDDITLIVAHVHGPKSGSAGKVGVNYTLRRV